MRGNGVAVRDTAGLSDVVRGMAGNDPEARDSVVLCRGSADGGLVEVRGTAGPDSVVVRGAGPTVWPL